MIRLSLISSGITDGMKRGAFPAREDSVLEPHSIALADALKERLKANAKAKAISGMDPRARITAELLGLSAKAHAGLDDQDFGAWASKKLTEISKSKPAALAAWITDPNFAPQGGESLSALAARTEHFLEEMEKRSGHIIAVTHAGIVRCAVLHVLGAPVSGFWRIDTSPLTITDLRHDGKRWALRSHGAAELD